MRNVLFIIMLMFFINSEVRADEKSDLLWCENDYASIAKRVMSYRQNEGPIRGLLHEISNSGLDWETQDLYEGLATEAFKMPICSSSLEKIEAVKTFSNQALKFCLERVQSNYRAGF